MWTRMTLVSKWIGVLWIWTAANFAPTKELTKERFYVKCKAHAMFWGRGKGRRERGSEREKRERNPHREYSSTHTCKDTT